MTSLPPRCGRRAGSELIAKLVRITVSADGSGIISQPGGVLLTRTLRVTGLVLTAALCRIPARPAAAFTLVTGEYASTRHCLLTELRDIAAVQSAIVAAYVAGAAR
jgi:hypothetical protein